MPLSLGPTTAQQTRWKPLPRARHAGLAVIEAGAGPLVILLHGVGLRAEAWAPILDALAQNHRVLAPDMLGHGDSPLPGDNPNLQTYTNALLPLLDAPALVVGHSMGALMALDLAARYPGKLRGVAALNAVFERDPAGTQAVQTRAAQLDGRTPPDPAPTLDRWFGQDDHKEREACAKWLSTVDPKGYQIAYTTFAHDPGPSRAALEILPCPALFMTGAEEPNSTPAMSRAMAALAPHGRCEIVEGAAHMMPMTHRREVVTALSRLTQESLA